MSKEYEDYLSSLKNYRDLDNQLNTKLVEGETKGIKKGRREEKIEIAREMIKKEIDVKTISDCTGLTLAEVKALREE